MYQLTGVTKHYTRGRKTVRALDGIDLDIEDGGRLVIQGPTGGGKSTLLQMLGGLDRPTSGSVRLGDRDLGSLSEAQLTKVRGEMIGFVFQSFNLIPTLNAQENVETALVPMGVGKQERARRAEQALASVGLGERLGHTPAELSGGQQQRVAIARALVKEPRVLLADEPTGNLDEETRDDIMSLLEQLWRDRGLTFVMVTHDTTVAARAPRLAVIRAGKVSIQYNAPAAPAAAPAAAGN